MLKPAVTALAIFLPAASADVATPGDPNAGRCGDAAAGPCLAVATKLQSAVVKVQGSVMNGAALEVTARPLSADSSTPFLVQVYVDKNGRPHETPELLGSFSFLPARAGQAQTFVLPKPATGARSSVDFTLAIKLVPANPARELGDAAVEILGARLVNE